jgi:hypothetical protein
MKRASLTILMQEMDNGQTSVDHFLAGDCSLELAASVCRMIANKLDKERIRAEVEAEAENVDA